MKLATISCSPMPYNTPVLNELARRLDLHAIFMTEDDHVNRFVDVWGTEPEFDHSLYWSKDLNVESLDLHAQVSFGISRQLAKIRPDAILVFSWKPTVVEPLVWARASGAATVMWAESTMFSGLLRGAVSTRIRREIVRRFDSFVTNGSQGTAFLEALGVPARRIVTSKLPAGATSATVVERTNGSSASGVRFLFVGRLIPRKRPLELIAAFAAVQREMPDATLTIVGGGQLEPEVRQAAARTPGVHYAGFHEGEALSMYYRVSDVLVLPALREVWGLVVNEALGHGLYVVATDEVGSAYDLLDERSGVMLPANDLDRLAPTLIETARVLDLSDEARHVRAQSVADCTPSRFADDVRDATALAIRLRASRSRLRLALR